MKITKKLWCLSLAVLLCMAAVLSGGGRAMRAFADDPAPQYSYKKMLDNGRKFFYMRGIGTVDDTEFLALESGLYYSDTLENIYTIEPIIQNGNSYRRYMYKSIILSLDGIYIVNLPWTWYNWNQEGGTTIEFFKEGKLIKEYGLSDLVQDFSKLSPTVSHVFWEDGAKREFDTDKNTLSITTLDGLTYLFDITTGLAYEDSVTLKEKNLALTQELEQISGRNEELTQELELLGGRNEELMQKLDGYDKKLDKNTALTWIFAIVACAVLIVNAAILILYIRNKQKNKN